MGHEILGSVDKPVSESMLDHFILQLGVRYPGIAEVREILIGGLVIYNTQENSCYLAVERRSYPDNGGVVVPGLNFAILWQGIPPDAELINTLRIRVEQAIETLAPDV